MEKIPVTTPYFDESEESAACDAIRSGWVAQGPRVTEFEKVIAAHEGVGYGVATTSCTTALHLAMAASGLGPGMDAIAPSFTFVATANSIVISGATPILADVRRDTYCIDPESVRSIIENRYERRGGNLVNKATGNVLWGIVPVHQFGLCCDIHEINAIAKEYGLKVIEDAACALGAKIGDTHEGAFGNISCLSFHPRKSITTGEGGMVLVNDGEAAERMRHLRSHGSTVSADARDKGKGFLLPSYDEAGYNYRMTDIQAAVGLAQAKKLGFILEEKRRKALLYNKLIARYLPEVVAPVEPDGWYHTYQSYCVMLDDKKLGFATIDEGGTFRNALLDRLDELGVATRQGTHAVHTLGYYVRRFGYKPEDLPNAYACDRLSISIPLYVRITDEQQEYVVKAIRGLVDELRG